MKASASLLFLFLVVAGCTDTINSPTGLKAPSSTTGVIRGNPPPPPADAIVSVCSSASGCTVFEGTYFSDGADDALTAAITQLVEGACTFPESTSWLKFGNHQDPIGTDGEVSANAQIRCHNGRAAGNGRIEYSVAGQAIVIQLQDVQTFVNSPECSVAEPFCASFTANVTINGAPAGVATGQAFNREFFEENCDIGEGGSVFCGEIGID
jgi:hypothetical protein